MFWKLRCETSPLGKVMKQKPSTEFAKFDKVMGGLLSVPYKELQQKLDDEKRLKAQKKKKRAKTSPASRVSSDRKS